MGRKTWDSIPSNRKPLPNRVSVVLTSQSSLDVAECEGKLKLVKSLAQAIQYAEEKGETELIVIGGEGVFKEVIPLCKKMHFTRVHADVEGDTFFPAIDWSQWALQTSNFHAKDSENQYDFTTEIYLRK